MVDFHVPFLSYRQGGTGSAEVSVSFLTNNHANVAGFAYKVDSPGVLIFDCVKCRQETGSSFVRL